MKNKTHIDDSTFIYRDYYPYRSRTTPIICPICSNCFTPKREQICCSFSCARKLEHRRRREGPPLDQL